MTYEAQAGGLGIVGLVASGVAMATGHPAAMAVAAASAGVMVGVIQSAVQAKVPRAAGVGAMDQRAEFFKQAILRGSSGYYTFKSSPLLADMNERGIKKAAEGTDLHVYRIPGQGLEPTSFVVSKNPRNYAGAEQVYGGETAPRAYDTSRPPSIDNIIRIPVIVKRRGDTSPRIQATTAPSGPSAFKGAGGWSYFRAKDGSFLIVNDPRPGQPMQGKTVARGSKAWTAIDNEMRSNGY